MDWSAYTFLVGILISCLAILCVLNHFAPELLHRSHTRTRAELVCLGCVVALGLAAIYFNFYRGKLAFAYLDVGNDTSEQYLPYYCNMFDAIRTGTFGPWNHEYGLGTSFVSYQSWTLDPFNLLLLPFCLKDNSHLALALVIAQSVKVALSALFVDHLLTFYCNRPISRIVGAVTCAFSGYLMLWGQHYWLGTVFVMATLLPLLLELLMERRTAVRVALLALGVALSISSSVYSGFMVMLFATAYALLRTAYLTDGNPRDFLRLFGRLTLPVLCGIMLSLVFVVPYATLMLSESTRVVGSSDSSMTSRAIAYMRSFVPARWIPMVLSRAMGNGLVSYGQEIPEAVMPPTQGFSYVNVYEIIMLGLGGGLFLLLSQFVAWVARETDRLTKVLVALASLLVILYCFNFFLPAFSNALVAPKYRSAFAVVIPTSIAMAVGFDRCVARGRIARAPLAVACALSLFVVLWSLRHAVDGKVACVWYVLAICVSTGALWLLAHGVEAARRAARDEEGADDTNPREPVHAGILAVQPHFIIAVCCTALISTSIIDGYLSTNRRAICGADHALGTASAEQESDTKKALAWLREQDKSFWRVEKLYNDWTWLNDCLAEGYPGVASYNSTLDADVEEFYAKLWPENIGGDIAYQVFRNDPNEPSLLDMLGVKYLLSRGPIDWNGLQELTQFGDIHVYRKMGAQGLLTLRGDSMGESEADTFSPKDKRELLDARVIVPDEDLDLVEIDQANATKIDNDDLAGLDLAWMELEDDKLGENGQPTSVPDSQARLSCTNGNSLKGKVFANTDSVGCLAIPHVGGWTVRIDGQEVPTCRANYGFIGFAVPAGLHEVEASYERPHAGLGVALSLVGLVCTVALCISAARSEEA